MLPRASYIHFKGTHSKKLLIVLYLITEILLYFFKFQFNLHQNKGSRQNDMILSEFFTEQLIINFECKLFYY